METDDVSCFLASREKFEDIMNRFSFAPAWYILNLNLFIFNPQDQPAAGC